MKLVNDKKDNGNGFIMQAGILAAAGIISRIIGLLYRSPLAEVIGDLGLGYYQSAYAYYTIILLISSYSIPSAISKVIAQKLAVGEYRNAHRLFRGALYYALAVGAVGGCVLFFGAGLFVEETAVPVLRIFAPTVFVYGILGVLRGYFQAHKSMQQTAVSQIVEQIANAVVSVGAAVLLIRLMMGSLAMPEDSAAQVQRAVYGAMGSALGTGMGVLTAMVFMLITYMRYRPEIMGRVRTDEHRQQDTYRQIFVTITAIVTPFILSTAIYNLSSSVNTKIYTDIYPSMMALDTVEITSRWGVFSGKALTISNIPVAFASAMASAMIPSVAQLMAAGKKQESCEKIGLAVKTTMLISIPCAVGLFVFAAPVTLLLFPSTASNIDLASRVLMALCPSVVLYALSTLNSSILQGLGKVKTPIYNAGIALAIQTVFALLLLRFTNMDLYSIAIANTLYSGIMAFLNQSAVRRAVGYRQEILRTFVLPAVASGIMGVVSYGVYYLLRGILHSPRLAVIPAILVAVPVYFVSLLLVKGLDETELRSIPKGYLLVKLAKKCRLMK